MTDLHSQAQQGREGKVLDFALVVVAMAAVVPWAVRGQQGGFGLGKETRKNQDWVAKETRKSQDWVAKEARITGLGWEKRPCQKIPGMG
eukprot:365116-Chlamydomonas_euryale.AAC.8